MHAYNNLTYLGQGTARSGRLPIGVRLEDRLASMYVLGKTGVGKSTLLETLVTQDLHFDHGLALIENHGDLVSKLAHHPYGREITYFNVPDVEQPYGYNPLRPVASRWRGLAASGVLEVFKKAWPDAWGDLPPGTGHSV